MRPWAELTKEEKERVFWRIVEYHPFPCRIQWSLPFLLRFLAAEFNVYVNPRGPMPKRRRGGDPSGLQRFLWEFREFCRRHGVPVIFNDQLPKARHSRRVFIVPSLRELEELGLLRVVSHPGVNSPLTRGE